MEDLKERLVRLRLVTEPLLDGSNVRNRVVKLRRLMVQTKPAKMKPTKKKQTTATTTTKTRTAAKRREVTNGSKVRGDTSNVKSCRKMNECVKKDSEYKLQGSPLGCGHLIVKPRECLNPSSTPKRFLLQTQVFCLHVESAVLKGES